MVDDILHQWRTDVGRDYVPYRHHVYRVIHFCLALRDCDDGDRRKIITAACFHDLGLVAAHTADYLPPSVELARTYLHDHGLASWTPEIGLMIAEHHKLRAYTDPGYPLVEVLRRADLVDLSLGLVKFGLPSGYVDRVRQAFPNAGFHRRLVQLLVPWAVRHPFRALPYAKW